MSIVQVTDRFPSPPDSPEYREHRRERVRERFGLELMEALANGGIVGPIHEQVSEQEGDMEPRPTRATKDERYRIGQTQTEISEALWQVAKEYGITDRIAVDEQVAISRGLANVLRRRSGPLTRSDILGQFERFGVRSPSNGFAKDVIARLERLDPGREWPVR